MTGIEPIATLPAAERLEAILAKVSEAHHVTVRDLARATGVSEATIRRDLKLLSDRSLVDLVYGGATSPHRHDDSLLARARRNPEAKKAIGDLAGALVADGQMLFVDSGTTCFEMRRSLRRLRGLTVLTNSTRVAMELSGLAESQMILLAGQYRPDRMDVVGPLAVQSIDQLRGYAAFIGADGLSMDFGVSASEMQTAHLYQRLIHNSRETILLADHSKFGVPSLFRIADFDSVTSVVTDRDPGSEWRTFLSDKGIALVFPPADANLADAAPPQD